MGNERRVALFRIGNSQAVNIPAEFELPGDEAIMQRIGGRLTLEALKKRDLLTFLGSMKPFNEPFPDID